MNGFIAILICIVIVECKNNCRRRIIPWNDDRGSGDRELSCTTKARPECASETSAYQAQRSIFRLSCGSVPHHLNIRDSDRITIGVGNSHAHRIAGITDRLGSDVPTVCD